MQMKLGLTAAKIMWLLNDGQKLSLWSDSQEIHTIEEDLLRM